MRTDRVALIIGASRGIGQACARAFSAEGWSLRMVARDRDRLRSIADGLPATGQEHRFLGADLSGDSGRNALLEWVGAETPDAVIQAMGGAVVAAGQADPWLAAMKLNFHAVVATDELLLPRMLHAARGSIVHLSSSAASHGRAFTPYACAKAALNRYIVNRGRECLPSGVVITGLMPAAVEGDDNGWSRARREDSGRYDRMVRGQALGRPQTTDEVAATILALCGPAGRVFGGCVLPADASIAS